MTSFLYLELLLIMFFRLSLLLFRLQSIMCCLFQSVCIRPCMLASSSSPLLHCLSQSVPTCTSRCFSPIRPVVFPYIRLFSLSVNSSSSSLSFIYTSFFIILHSRALQPLLYLLFILLFFIILHSRGTWRRARRSR